jgi:tetratricopeptide (TPR) repeat protein
MDRRYSVKPNERSYRSAVIACNQAEHERIRHLSSEGYSEDWQKKDDPSLQWWECSLALLRRMREEGLVPDIQTYSSCISACEAAGQWQRAVGVLQTMIDDSSAEGTEEKVLNLFCFNAAVAACEKGGAWVEALEIYERMITYGGSLKPNFVTLSSLVLALSRAGQKELAQSKYEEGIKRKIVNPWRFTKDIDGNPMKAMVRNLCYFGWVMQQRCAHDEISHLAGLASIQFRNGVRRHSKFA